MPKVEILRSRYQEKYPRYFFCKPSCFQSEPVIVLRQEAAPQWHCIFGWQPLVKRHSRLTGEHVFIYAKEEGKDMKLLVVSVKPAEALVVQLKMNPDQVARFVDEDLRNKAHGSSVAMAFR